MSINVETKKAYTEVVKVLNSLPDNDYRKIPEDVMLTLEKIWILSMSIMWI